MKKYLVAIAILCSASIGLLEAAKPKIYSKDLYIQNNTANEITAHLKAKHKHHKPGVTKLVLRHNEAKLTIPQNNIQKFHYVGLLEDFKVINSSDLTKSKNEQKSLWKNLLITYQKTVDHKDKERFVTLSIDNTGAINLTIVTDATKQQAMKASASAAPASPSTDDNGIVDPTDSDTNDESATDSDDDND